MTAPTVCQIDTCGENRDSGKPWPAEYAVTRDGRTIIVCACHADGCTTTTTIGDRSHSPASPPIPERGMS